MVAPGKACIQDPCPLGLPVLLTVANGCHAKSLCYGSDPNAALFMGFLLLGKVI